MSRTPSRRLPPAGEAGGPSSQPASWRPGFDAARVPVPGDRVFAFSERALLLDADSRVPRAETLDLAGALFLGELDGCACFAAAAAAVPEGLHRTGLREALGALPEPEAAVAGRALQTLDWARDHRFCGRCGTPTEPVADETATVCPRCGARFYPRIAPAAIMLVTRGESLLLARRAGGRTGVHSCLAGFVEPGETLEETVAREVREEVSLEVGTIRYFGSQPWPFPGQLMVGFTAEHVSGEIEVDPVELAGARWFGPSDELPPLPPPYTIARRLIDAFRGA